MKKDEVTLEQFNQLAYEFAIRNPRVIELLHKKLTKEVVDELAQYGIRATSACMDDNGNEHIIYSLQELYLDYEHLKDIKHEPCLAYSHPIDDYIGEKFLLHPEINNFFPSNIDQSRALKRIQGLIETRGKKLERLLNGEAFTNYDAVTFRNQTVYSVDPSTNKKKTIENDIKFIREWTNPEKYLQLLPSSKDGFFLI